MAGKADIGIVGMAVMGQNLALNIESRGYQVAVYNRTTQKTRDFISRHSDKNLVPAETLKNFVASLKPPRKVILLVKAGPTVDAVIKQLAPLLNAGDLITDGGNSFFQDTERRAEGLETKGVLYLGTGISGGEEGARRGPSIMPGGQKEAYKLIEPIFTAIAAKVNGKPCVTYIGPGGAGHYVKMVHNGIEYGIMQLLAESYDLLSRGAGFSMVELHHLFVEWNKGELSSYLMEITADIFAKTDEETGKPLVEIILDEAKQKGTGKWTSQNALDLGIPTPTINAAVESRIISALKKERGEASQMLSGPTPRYQGNKDQLADSVKNALYAAIICSYVQGFALLRSASKEYRYDLSLVDIATIWRGGCIIRAKLLDPIRAAFEESPDLANLLLDPRFAEMVQSRQNEWRSVVQAAVTLGIPCLAFSASLAYYDAYRSGRLPANLTQAQRDYFGAHTYRRLDKEGSFHSEWKSKTKESTST